MIKKCDTNQNSSILTLIEKIIKFFTKQAMQAELGLQGKGKYTLVGTIYEPVRKQLAANLSDYICIQVENFLHRVRASTIVPFVYSKKLDLMCTISSVKAEAYEVAARQIMIDSNNIQLIEHTDGLSCVMVYDTVSAKKKPTWWTVRTDDVEWTKARYSCAVYQARKLCVHVVIACQKVDIVTYLLNYSKSSKPSATQIIQAQQKELKKHAGCKGNRPCHGGK